jgi:Phosphoribosylglycinamide synthetase, C domain
VVVFHSGTSQVGKDIITTGGRVIAVTAFASTLSDALKLAYTRIDGIDFEGKTYRKDIAHRYDYTDCFTPRSEQLMQSIVHSKVFRRDRTHVCSGRRVR